MVGECLTQRTCVLGQASLLVVVGVVVGVAGALGEGRLGTRMLYRIKPADPTTLALMTVLLLLVAMGATFIPARRASRVDPIIALRQE